MKRNREGNLPGHRITVHNRQRAIRIPMAAMQQFADRALAECLKTPTNGGTELTSLADLHVILVSDRRMAALHRKFLHQSGSTDVITFHHGEIFISVERARSQGRQFRTSIEKELCLYIVHGLLHLHGFDDTKPAAARKMERTQNRVLMGVSQSKAVTRHTRSSTLR